MIRVWIFLIVVALAAASPVGIRAQQIEPCKAIAPGVRCATKPLPSVWMVDFGAPTIAPKPKPDLTPWRAQVWWHHSPDSSLMRVPTLEVPGLLDPHPIDCAMARPGSTTLDPKIIRTHRGGPALSGVIIPVAPCPKK